jgi:hypothetical protein
MYVEGKNETDANTVTYPWPVFGQGIVVCRHKELKP